MKRWTVLTLATSLALAALLSLGACAGTSESSSSSEEDAASSAPVANSKPAGKASSAPAASSAASSEQAPAALSSRTDAQIVDAVLDKFNKIAAIPRPSQNEQRMSDYLKGWAEELGFEVVQDAANNIIFDVPATKGLENLPRVGLQGHMDMVCVAAPGVAYDPVNDPIEPVRNDAADTLGGNGTALGADGGIGMAMVMDLVDGGMSHGPLRVIFTTDEEVSMTGAQALDASYVANLDYLVNLDGELADVVIVSCAGGVTGIATGSLEIIDATADTAATITLDGLMGGHSGLQINEGRCNAIRTMAELLRKLGNAGVSFGIASFAGGTAENVIPASAQATIVYQASDDGKVRDQVNAYANELVNSYANAEPNLSLRIDAADMPGQVLTDDSAKRAIDYALGIVDGVYSISQEIDDFVESSSNLGTISVSTIDGFGAVSYIRAANDAKMDEIVDQQSSIAAASSFDFQAVDRTEPWPYNENSKLVALCEKVYKDNTGKELDSDAIHASLECGLLSDKNPKLDIVSIGPSITNANSPEETVALSSIPRTWRLLEGVLVGIS